ncbi:MAG: NAD(P)/FAD-dependent oxidoreductase [Dehalococcoidia bacterium]
MPDKYDLVVIGSGVGGLSAAALAVKNGYKTLVLESLGQVGGRYSTFEVEGCKCLTGACVIHYSGWVPKVFKEVGVPLELRDAQDVYYNIMGNEFPVPLENRVSALFDICNRVGSASGKARNIGAGMVKEVSSKKLSGFFGKAVMNPKDAGGLTVREWLMQYTDDPVAHALFDSLSVGWVVAHSYEIPASEYFAFMATMKGMNDIGLSPQGNRHNMEQLAMFVKNNGDIWLGSPATRINVRDKKATTVVCKKEGGEEVEIECKAVISNCGPTLTAELADCADYTEDYLRDMRVKLRAIPTVMMHVASDKPLAMPGGEHGMELVAGMRRIIAAVPLTNTCPELAPKGTLLYHFVGMPKSTLVAMDPEEEVRQCMADLRELYPDFDNVAKVISIEPRNVDDNLNYGRSWQAAPYQMPRETPIRNLWCVGDGNQSRGYVGTSGCAEGAWKAVDALKKAVKPS